MKKILIIGYLIIFLIIGIISLKNYNGRYDIDFKNPMIYRIKSIPYDEYTDGHKLESMIQVEKEYAEIIWDSFENGKLNFPWADYIGEGDEIDWNNVDLRFLASDESDEDSGPEWSDSTYISFEQLGKEAIQARIRNIVSDKSYEMMYLPLRKCALNTIQKIILIEDYLIEYPEGLRQLDKYLDYSDMRDIEDKIKESILSDIKTPNILEIWYKEDGAKRFPNIKFDDTLDVENYERVNKLFDSLFRIYEMKNNYHKRYTDKTEFQCGWADN